MHCAYARTDSASPSYVEVASTSQRFLAVGRDRLMLNFSQPSLFLHSQPPPVTVSSESQTATNSLISADFVILASWHAV